MPHGSKEKGLAGLTEQVFGLALDKRDQRSNWNKRPLTQDQLVYAALDAYVLIELYESLFDLAFKKELEDKFNYLESYMRKNKNKPPKTKPVREATPKSAPPTSDQKQKEVPLQQLNDTPINPPDLRVVCDHMLNVRDPF